MRAEKASEFSEKQYVGEWKLKHWKRKMVEHCYVVEVNVPCARSLKDESFWRVAEVGGLRALEALSNRTSLKEVSTGEVLCECPGRVGNCYDSPWYPKAIPSFVAWRFAPEVQRREVSMQSISSTTVQTNTSNQSCALCIRRSLCLILCAS